MFSKTVGNTWKLQELQKYSITIHKSVKVKTLGVAHLDNKTSSLVNLTKLPLHHWHNPTQKRVCLGFGSWSEGPQERGGVGFSWARCARTWCVGSRSGAEWASWTVLWRRSAWSHTCVLPAGLCQSCPCQSHAETQSH